MATIENEYRVFQMEVLAGPPCLDTEVSQHGARFRLNFGEVRGRGLGFRVSKDLKPVLWHPQRAVWPGHALSGPGRGDGSGVPIIPCV